MANELNQEEQRGMLARLKASASALIRKHGPEVGAVAKIAAHALIPGAPIVVGAIEATCDYAADKGRDLNQDQIDEAMLQRLDELGGDVAQLESLLGHLAGQLDGVLSMMTQSAQFGSPPQALEAMVNTALEAQFSDLRAEFRALTPELETVKRQGAQMLRQQAIQGDILNQVQDQLSAALAYNAPLAGEGVVGSQVGSFLGARGRFQSALLNGDLEGAERALAEMKEISPNGNTSRVSEMALRAARRDFEGAERVARTIVGSGADDPRVRRAVTSLTSITRASAQSPTPRPTQPARYEAGSKIGDREWELTALLGRGGMGSVWRARNRRGREGAVKLMSASLSADTGFIARFQAEIDALDRVNHSAVVKILDWGRDRSRAWYFVMPFIEGHSLRSRLARGQLGSDEVKSIARALAAGLVACHAQGVIHRDIKPENVMLKSDGSPVLIDFGIAHQEGASTGHTRMATGGYAPPEQLAGRAVDATADLYALGMTLAECLGAQANEGAWGDLIDRLTHRLPMRRGTAQALLERLSPSERAPRIDVTRISPTQTTSVENPEVIARAALERAERMAAEALARAEAEANRLEELRAERARAVAEEEARAARVRKLNAQREAVELVTRHIQGELDESALQSALKASMLRGPLSHDELPEIARSRGRLSLETGDRILIEVGDVIFYERVIPAPPNGAPFLMMETQVTQALYQAVTGQNPSRFKGSNLPVEKVSWEDSIAFCNALSERLGLAPAYRGTDNDCELIEGANGFRLPFEAEWEFAAYGGENSEYAGSDQIYEVAWYKVNSGSETHPVGQKKANGYGLYDMSGNVWEWCADGYSDPGQHRLGVSRRARRGGSWYGSADSCRVSNLGSSSPERRGNYLGLRLSRSVRQDSFKDLL